MKLRKKIIIVLVITLAIIGNFFYIYNQIYFSHGTRNSNKIFNIEKGEGNSSIAKNLKAEGIISQKIYFWLYLKSHNLMNKIYPGAYLLNGNLTIPEIATLITNPQKSFVSITFPEGWTAKQMANRLNEKGFDGKAFLDLVNNPPKDIISQFSIFSDKPERASLEGYIFPDTYNFSKDATPEGILKKILNNTELKMTDDIKNEIAIQKKSIFRILTMASIIEKEVSTIEDFKIVSGIFWKRIADGRNLQSCATLAYILGVNKDQYTYEDTQVESPYNTYKYKGLPPGPISNPGINTIYAALNPENTNYNYFLTDPKNPKNTVYSATFEQHVANKLKFGL